MNDISKNFTCNESIKEKEVRVIDSEGNQLGILQTKEALRMADESELDLVMISPNAKPPVCKIMDLGKYFYEQAKKEKEAKKKQKVTVIKEIRCGITIEENDIVIKAKNARKFLVEKLNEISNVTEVITYESVMDDSKKEEAIKVLEEGNLDYITFASSSTVTNFINLIGEENKDKLSNTKIISIGRITTKTILDNNLEVYKQAENASIESMIEAMSE